MDRRLALIGLGGALAPIITGAMARPAVAQASATPFDYSAYRQATLAISTISREASEIALRRATNARVRTFAGLERAEQLTLEQVMSGLQNPPLAPIDAQHRTALAKLNGLPEGNEFDSAYVNAEIEGHESLLSVQESLLRVHPAPTTDHVHIAFFMRTFIHEHLTLLADIKTALG